MRALVKRCKELRGERRAGCQERSQGEGEGEERSFLLPLHLQLTFMDGNCRLEKLIKYSVARWAGVFPLLTTLTIRNEINR